MREVLDFRYSASDIYIVCLMHCTCAEDQEINIIDKQEVIEAEAHVLQNETAYWTIYTKKDNDPIQNIIRSL
jgi:hypothetical protein